jgi:hypothetical protein
MNETEAMPKGFLARHYSPLSSLLASLLLSMLIYPFFATSAVARITWDLCFSAVLLTGIHAVSWENRRFALSMTLGLIALASKWLAYVVPSLALVLVSYGLGVIFFAFAVGTLLSYVLRDEKVTVDKIYGAICVYLFIGMIWGLLFSLLEGLQPGSFSGQAPAPRVEPDPSVLIYYSFITLSTVGYGDIVPISPPARSFAYLEGIIGQFYLAVLVARLVGLHIAYAGAQSEQGGVVKP